MTDNRPNELDYFWAALMFYTRIPVPNNTLHSQQVLNKSRKYLPLMGIIVGSIAGLTYLCASAVFGSALSITLSLAASILVTGAFHEDGFADTCDGFGGGWTHEQVLTIMKDSRVGSYALVGLVLLLLSKVLVLVEIVSVGNTALFFTVYVAGHTLSRSLASMAIEYFDYVQDIDKSKVKPMTENRLSLGDKCVSACLCSLPLLCVAWFDIVAVVVASLVAAAAALLFMAYSKQRIGGYTGDVLGATQQLSELGFYLCFAALI